MCSSNVKADGDIAMACREWKELLFNWACSDHSKSPVTEEDDLAGGDFGKQARLLGDKHLEFTAVHLVGSRYIHLHSRCRTLTREFRRWFAWNVSCVATRNFSARWKGRCDLSFAKYSRPFMERICPRLGHRNYVSMIYTWDVHCLFASPIV